MTKKLKVSIGNKYYKLTPLRTVGKDKNGNILYECQCDCGKFAILKGTSLTMRTRPTRSCGCYIKESHMLAPGEAVANSLYRRYLKRDKDAHRLSDLTMDAFLKFTQSPCAYCGSPPSQKLTFKNANGSYTYNGLDRVDNKLGYTNTNVVACCKTCNHMKRDMGVLEFLAHLNKIVSHTVQKTS